MSQAKQLDAQMTGSLPADRLLGVGRCAADSGSPHHSHRSSSPPCRWPERSWTDSFHHVHTPCTACRGGSRLLIITMSVKKTQRQFHQKSNQVSYVSYNSKNPEAIVTGTGKVDSPRQTWVLQALLWRLRPPQGEELQRRERNCCPPPQLTEHADHWDQGSQGPTESVRSNILRFTDTTAW